MNKLVLWSPAVNDFLTQHGHVLSAPQRTSLPDAVVTGVCVVVIVAILRAAMAIHIAAFESVPLLRTLVLIVLTLVLLSAISLTGDHGTTPAPPAGTPAKVRAV